MFKPFFVHFNKSKHGDARWMRYPRGFTAYVKSTENPREISVQLIYCSPKDQFCKKTGRELVMKKEPILMNPRSLQKLLELAAEQCNSWTRFEYLYKYMV